MTKSRRGHGEGTIYRYRDGWAAAANLGWKDGRRRRKFVYGKTQSEVKTKLKALHRAIDEATNSGLEETVDPTLAVYLEHWMSDVLPGTVRESTLQSYTSVIRLHILPALGEIRLNALNPAQVRTLLRAKVEETSARGRPRSARSVQYMHAILRRGLEQARKDELVTRNVASLVSPPRVRRAEVQPFTVEEARKLLETAEAHRLHALYTLAIALGMRKGELLGLAWTDIDFATSTLYVRSTLQRINHQGLQLSEPKTLRSRRRIPLPAFCYIALEQHRQRQALESTAEHWHNPHNLVFTSAIGTPIEPRNLTRHFESLCRKAGVSVLRFHDLRHTSASLLLAQGVDARTIMETLGHSMIGTTLNLYAHVAPAVQRAAADEMEVLFGSLGSTDGSTGASGAESNG